MRPKLTNYRERVLAAVAAADRGGWSPQPAVIAACGMRQQTAYQTLRELVDAGDLDCEIRHRGPGGGGGRESVFYRPPHGATVRRARVQGGPAWWVGLPRAEHQAQAAARARDMSASPEAKYLARVVLW
jgi:hypothetical protein